jgi:adenylate cyclase
VVGDSVNLASRMEGLTKHFGSTLVLGAATRERITAPDQFAMRSLGSVAVEGWTAGMEMFECVACYPETLQKQIMTIHDVYSDGLAAYRAGRWAQAQNLFERCVDACEQDVVAKGFIRRCRDRSLHDQPWDGIERPAKG